MPLMVQRVRHLVQYRLQFPGQVFCIDLSRVWTLGSHNITFIRWASPIRKIFTKGDFKCSLICYKKSLPLFVLFGSTLGTHALHTCTMIDHSLPTDVNTDRNIWDFVHKSVGNSSRQYFGDCTYVSRQAATNRVISNEEEPEQTFSYWKSSNC